jgi:hypothetical protein
VVAAPRTVRIWRQAASYTFTHLMSFVVEVAGMRAVSISCGRRMPSLGWRRRKFSHQVSPPTTPRSILSAAASRWAMSLTMSGVGGVRRLHISSIHATNAASPFHPRLGGGPRTELG